MSGVESVPAFKRCGSNPQGRKADGLSSAAAVALTERQRTVTSQHGSGVAPRPSSFGLAELPDPDRLGEDEPTIDVDEDDNLEVVPEDLR